MFRSLTPTAVSTSMQRPEQRNSVRLVSPGAQGAHGAGRVSASGTMRRRVRSCSRVTPNVGECDAVCPKEIELGVIALMNREFPPANWEGSGIG
jgi:hypothetical protein